MDERFDVVEATIGDVHEAYRNGALTAVELVERYRRRIEAHDDELNAILVDNPDADERAAALDDALAADGEFVGPLHGIPVILKDNQATADLPTTAGSATLADAVPPRDASVVERLREAGAIVLAKANLQEFSFGVDTVSSLGGETRNAYATDRRPSGSSGGTATAVAANLGLLGTGSDTCSSVRSPPAFASLVGIRPTRGLVSRTGVVPLCDTQDTVGPIARTVADAARMLDAMVGYDPEDPISARGVGRVPEDGYAAGLADADLSDARIGAVRDFFGLADDSLEMAAGAAAVTRAIDEAVAELRAAGATVVDPVSVVDPDRLADARVLHLEFKRDLERYLAEWAPDVAHETMAELLETGEIHPWIEARMDGAAILDVDVDGLAENREYLRRLERRRELRDDTLAAMADADVDALAYPPSTVPPVEFPDRQPFSEMRCELAAHTGLPAIVVPAGFTADGLPVGLELLGRPFAERELVDIAHVYERETAHREPPDGFGSLG